jgi:parvulin-like peptidyl-prolyl isomerase
MTTRTPAAAKRPSRSGRDAHDRKHLYVNLAFGLVIFIGVVALIGAAASTYAGQHFTEVATVNGQTVTEDAYRDGTLVDSFRLNQAEAQIRDQLQLGRISQSESDTRVAALEQQRQGLANATLERLIDANLQAQLAKTAGITVDDAQIDQRLVDEATRLEQRHLGMITVTPDVSAGATGPTDAQKSAAQTKANQALADLKAGKVFEDVAKAVSTDTFASGGGDVGWVVQNNTSLDPVMLSAVFGLSQPGFTDVVAGVDGAYRIGRVAEIAPQTVDSTWVEKIKDAGVPIGAYRDAVRGDLIREALSTKIVADNTTVPTLQRKVNEIVVSSANYQGPGDEVRVRHILYTPGDADPGGASPLPSDDASWAAAQAKAQATFDKLKALQAQPDQLLAEFEKIAMAESKDTASGAAGGELDWFSQGALDTGFGDAIFADGLKKGDLIGPVKSQYGWHVILYEERRPPPEARANALQVQASAPGADFAKLAKDNSDGTDAATGGDLGWVARYQLDAAREKAIFDAPVGKASPVLATDGGFDIFLVSEEATRLPDGAQLETLKSSVFQNWYDAEKAKATITPDLSTSTP